MKVLVTGGAGYIGSVLTAELVMSGVEVVVLDKLIYGGVGVLALEVIERCSLLHGDVRVLADLREAMKGVDAVVHLGAVVGEPACALNEVQAREINIEGTKRALMVAGEQGVSRFVYVSTCSNYGVSAPNVLAREDSPLNPLSQYAKAKVEGEALTLANSGLPIATVLRLATICGLSPRMRFDLLISELARAAALGRKIEIFSPEAWRPFLHIRDAARSIQTILNTSKAEVDRKVFNVVGENYQKKSLIDMVLRYYPDSNIDVTSEFADLRDYRVSSDRIRIELGFEPTSTIEAAFVETANAVEAGIFRDPFWPGHSAVPISASVLEIRGGGGSSGGGLR